MTRQLTVTEPSEDRAAGTVGVHETTLETLAVSSGDPVVVRGDRETVGLTVTVDCSETGIELDETMRRNARVSIGDTVTVTATEAQVAETVVIAPTQAVDLRGDGAFDHVLDGRVLQTGDRIQVPLFGGAFTLSARVIDTTPDRGPVQVTETTAVSVRTDTGVGVDSESFRAARLDDVGGLDDTVDRLLELIAVPLAHPEVYEAFEAPPQSGVLLHGPSGAGKTLLLRALATEMDATAVTLSGHALAAAETTEAVERIRDAKQEAITEAPALLAVDDIEAIASADSSGHNRHLLARLIAVFDALADRSDVIVLGTTTDPDTVAVPLRRGGRFAVEVPVTAPDESGRCEILQILTRNVPIDDDVALGEIAARTHGFLGADLAALISEAVARGAKRLVAAAEGTGPIPESTLAEAELTAADLAAGARAVDPSGLRSSRVAVPAVTDADIGGLQTARQELARAIEWPLAHPELFAAAGVEAPSGVLLYGPPGTGKTLLAKAVANATDANFVSIAGPEILNRYVGESEAAVRRTFDTARQHAPAVVFIDEVDAITPRRGEQGDSSGVAERVVSQLLTELDGLEPLEDVVVVAATNRPDTIDPALLRPGRLERLVEVPLPDEAARQAILGVHTRDVPLAEDVDIDALAAQTERYTGSDLAAMVREAGLRAIESALDAGGSPGDVRVRRTHLEHALADIRPSVTAEMREYYADLEEELGRSS